MTTEFLITTNGFMGTWPAIEYGAWLAEAMQMKITLLGVTERLSPAAIDDHHPREDVFERAVSLFKQKGVEYQLEVQNGEAEQVIPEKANEDRRVRVLEQAVVVRCVHLRRSTSSTSTKNRVESSTDQSGQLREALSLRRRAQDTIESTTDAMPAGRIQSNRDSCGDRSPLAHGSAATHTPV